MRRRLSVPELGSPGRVCLDQSQAHHARVVLRLAAGDAVELIDSQGRVGHGRIIEASPHATIIEVAQVLPRPPTSGLTIAAAVPKGERADWMVEKLAELGADRLVLLQAQRSVVLPRGVSKLERWRRLAAEAAKQSRRAGVMEITDLTGVAEALSEVPQGRGLCLSLGEDAQPLARLATTASAEVWVFVGPEGGWTDDELESFRAAGCAMVALTDTVLRVETAAVAAAAVLRCAERAPS